jgi:hypothetical protein
LKDVIENNQNLQKKIEIIKIKIKIEISKYQGTILKFCMGNVIFMGRRDKSEGRKKKVTRDES